MLATVELSLAPIALRYMVAASVVFGKRNIVSSYPILVTAVSFQCVFGLRSLVSSYLILLTAVSVLGSR